MRPPNYNGSLPKFWTKFLKLHLYDLLSYKGCLSVERPRTFGGERKKKLLLKIEYLHSHYVWAELVIKKFCALAYLTKRTVSDVVKYSLKLLYIENVIK